MGGVTGLRGVWRGMVSFLRRKTRLYVIAICLGTLLALSLAACSSGTTGTDTSGSGGGTPVETTATTVVEQNLEFFPSNLIVSVGTVVTFSNIDSTAHDVSIDGEALGMQESGASVTWTAKTVGTFPFKCTIHPSMTGQVVVK